MLEHPKDCVWTRVQRDIREAESLGELAHAVANARALLPAEYIDLLWPLIEEREVAFSSGY